MNTRNKPEVTLIVSADNGSGASAIQCAHYDFGLGAWGKAENISSILPSEYTGFTHPCFLDPDPAVGSNRYIAWDASNTNDKNEKLIVCMTTNADSIGRSYRILKGKTLESLHSGELWELSTGIGEKVSPATVTKGFCLEQNYPNPFNPFTIIKFTVGGAGDWGLGARKTMIVVYDVLGRQVATLVNEVKAPGSYEVRFDGTGLSSGVYFCRMQAGPFVQTRQLLLLR